MRTRPDVLTRVDLPGGAVTVDEYGYLTSPEEWRPEFAEHAAREEGIQLTPLHHDIIRFMRDYYDEHKVAVDQRFVLKYLQKRFDTDKHGAKDILFELFPQGYVKQACRIAGMRQPRTWSTG